jgi:hypothetical protein
MIRETCNHPVETFNPHCLSCHINDVEILDAKRNSDGTVELTFIDGDKARIRYGEGGWRFLEAYRPECLTGF